MKDDCQAVVGIGVLGVQLDGAAKLLNGPRQVSCGLEGVTEVCARFELDGQLHPLERLLIADLREEFERLSADGFRVLALAYKDLGPQPAYSKADERDLILKGYLAFLDPPKDSARAAIAALGRDGIAVKVLTGDNDLVSRKVCREVGIPTEHVLLGALRDRRPGAAPF
jgi:Mg2+-importing ATPase